MHFSAGLDGHPVFWITKSLLTSCYTLKWLGGFIMKQLPLILLLCLALTACATDEQTNAAVRGGAIGAAAGAVMSEQPVEGALVGGAIGAATGAVLADPNRRDGRGYRREDDRGDYHRDRGRHEGEYRYGRDDGYRHYRHRDDEEGDD